MKVSGKASRMLQQAQANNNAKSAKQNKMGALSKKGGAAATSAQVSLSTQAQQVKKATDIAKKDTVDEKKVAFFQNLIDSGKYKVESGKVADKLVDEHMKFPS